MDESQPKREPRGLVRQPEKLLLHDEVYAIVGAAIEVHRVLGPGFLEPVYQEALQVELEDRQVPFVADKLVPVMYKMRQLEKYYRADIICYDQIIVELKALDCLSNRESAQLLNYLKATKLRVGVLINFGSLGRLEWRRFAL